MSLPNPSTIPSLPQSEQTTLLDLLFEESEDLHSLVLPLLTSQTYPSYPALISAIGAKLTSLASPSSSTSTKADLAVLDNILGSHPRLGENRTGVLSALSAGEQARMKAASTSASASVGADSEAEAKAEAEAIQLERLNREYEKAFPGLRYVVFVNGRPRSVIMQDMCRRIEGSNLEAERMRAIQAMCEIANDRASKLV